MSSAVPAGLMCATRRAPAINRWAIFFRPGGLIEAAAINLFQARVTAHAGSMERDFHAVEFHFEESVVRSL